MGDEYLKKLEEKTEEMLEEQFTEAVVESQQPGAADPPVITRCRFCRSQALAEVAPAAFACADCGRVTLG